MPHQGNILSVFALLAWIPISFWGARRWPAAKATALLLLGAILFLPEKVAFKFPGLPEFGKTQIAIFWISVAVMAFHGHRARTVPLNRTLKILLAFLVLGPAVTVFLNGDVVSMGSVTLPAHTPHDVVHVVSGTLFEAGLPFVLGAAMFRGADDLRVLFRAMVGAALLYSLFQLVELVLSPQLHRWIYGFHPHDFVQMMRGGGYRPMVFMGHALAVSMFTFQAALASTALHRLKVSVFRLRAWWATAWLMVMLVLTKSVAPFVYGMVAVPLGLFTSPKIQVRVAAVLAVFALSYPVIRAADLIPIEQIGEFAEQQWGEDRAGSLMFRFENEDALLERSRERIWFGWGIYCRGCIFEPWSGSLVSIFDGEWIVALNSFGIVGFLGRFGILVFPVLFCWRRLGRVQGEGSRILLANLALLLGFSAVNLLPNSSNFIPFVLSGALYGSTHGSLVHSARLRSKKRAMRLAAIRQSQGGPATA
ncbi:MAG TPA: hypothetical protein VLS88_16135 [Polyangiales bacterium]|nr:hypothetical protein [Polyangiales bacterium]